MTGINQRKDFSHLLREVAERVGRIEALLARGGNDTGWKTPIWTNSWSAYAAPYGTSVGYRKRNGVVFMRGWMQTGTVGASAFTLPVGFRPVAAAVFAVSANQAFGELRVFPDGTVVLAAGSNAYVSLANVAFPADG